MQFNSFQDDCRKPMPYVLLVTSEHGSHFALEQLLVDHGFAVEVVRAGQSQASFTNPQQVVIDTRGVDATALLRRLMDEYPKTCVVLSNQPVDELAGNADEPGTRASWSHH
jgi:DNA-binding response OmpR family regulator